ncbi:netrin receptor DCC [Striga asiatica]|uniref:Netrin receptor DCC n=1 Tax=Striga asiatica TaxID=4170 RepID=A0A5A7NY99_STRAF|nr:netrin receptor DCC [Striga asiatica]
MLGFRATPLAPPSISPSKAKPILPFFPLQNVNFHTLPANHVKFQHANLRKFRIDTKDGLNGGEDGKAENGRPRLNLRWVNLVLDPDPDNIVAVGLTGLLTWASVQWF